MSPPYRSRFTPQPIISALSQPGELVQLQGGPLWTVEWGEVHIANGVYYVDGQQLPTTGIVHLTEGQRVGVLVEGGKRVAIIAQEVRRSGLAFEPSVLGKIDALVVVGNVVWHLAEGQDAKQLALPGLTEGDVLRWPIWSNSSDKYFAVQWYPATTFEERYNVYEFDRVARTATLVSTIPWWFTTPGYPYPPAGWTRYSQYHAPGIVTAAGQISTSFQRVKNYVGSFSLTPTYSDIVDYATGKITLSGEIIAPNVGTLMGSGGLSDAGWQESTPMFEAADPSNSLVVVNHEVPAAEGTDTVVCQALVDGLGKRRAMLRAFDHNWRPTSFSFADEFPVWFNGDAPTTPDWIAWAVYDRAVSYRYYLTDTHSGQTTDLGQGGSREGFTGIFTKATAITCGYAWYGGAGGMEPHRHYLLGVPREWQTSGNPMIYGPLEPTNYPDGGGNAPKLPVWVFAKPFRLDSNFQVNPTTGKSRQVPGAGLRDLRYELVELNSVPGEHEPLTLDKISVRFVA